MADSGILLLKYWLEVSASEQTRRLESRIHDPRKTWKLSMGGCDSPPVAIPIGHAAGTGVGLGKPRSHGHADGGGGLVMVRPTRRAAGLHRRARSR